jgi:DNA-binding transcriptional ArsR family regulator
MPERLSIPKIKKSCDKVCLILRSLSHPQRLLILSHLLRGSKNVSELVDLCEISQSQVSQFLTRMKFEGIVSSKKEGSYQMYRIADKKLIHLMRTIQMEYCKG